ncbi:MAG: hypothetical protein GDA54_03175 [Alphaproteobacteria bacterium GM7ARS4]|nr:hypothetical protein [Alphaproteobacteria bacterium GM7ARS4]
MAHSSHTMSNKEIVQAHRQARKGLKHSLSTLFASLPFAPEKVALLVKSGALDDHHMMASAQRRFRQMDQVLARGGKLSDMETQDSAPRAARPQHGARRHKINV